MNALSLAFLGQFQITVRGESIAAFESNKVRALLAYLAVESDRPHRRDGLAGLFWPERTERQAHLNLNQALSNLRFAIGDRSAEPPILAISRESIQFNRSSEVDIDVFSFTDRLTNQMYHRHRQPNVCKYCINQLRAAVSIYRGNFLERFYIEDCPEFEAWVSFKQEWYRWRALDALARLADYFEHREEYSEVQRCALQQLALEPWREVAHRQLMRALALSGQRPAALMQYQRCLQMLDYELGVEPETETTQLYEQILKRSLSKIPIDVPPPTNIEDHTPLTPFVDRKDELVNIAKALQDPKCRLLTLVGTGGIGKTRLALQAAKEQLNVFPDGVYFVPLAALNSPEYIIQAIVREIGLVPSSSKDLVKQLQEHLKDKATLLVLDNFEQLIEGTNQLISILRKAPSVVLLVTSREPLKLQAENILNLQGMQVPEENMIAGVESFGSIQLFLQTAGRIQFGFGNNTDDLAGAARICRLVGGIPLAVELAASLIRTQSCASIAEAIERNLDILSTEMRDVPRRHRSMRAVFDASWQLLAREEQSALEKFSVFRGGFTPEAAKAIASATQVHIDTLVDKSLLKVSTSNRYDMHYLLQQYSWEKLSDTGKLNHYRDRHLAYFLALAENGKPRLKGVEEKKWAQKMEKELDNFRHALTWAIESNSLESGYLLAHALGTFWQRYGYLEEGRNWLDKMLSSDSGQSSSIRAAVLVQAGALAKDLGDFDAAVEYSQASLSLFTELNDTLGIGRSFANLGIVYYLQEDYETGGQLLEQSLRIFRELGEESYLVDVLNRLTDLHLKQNQLDQASDLCWECLQLSSKLGDKLSIAFSLGGIGELHRLQGKFNQAVKYYKQALQIHWELHHYIDIPYTLEALALNCAGLGLVLEAARLWGAADELRTRHHAPLPPSYEKNYSEAQKDVNKRLGEEKFKKIWDEGRRGPLEQIIAGLLG